jgi:DnaK suppressor protein
MTTALYLNEDALVRLRSMLSAELAAQRERVAEQRRALADFASQGRLGRTLERELAEKLLQLSREAIEDLEQALDRVENGSYGACESCGRPIPVERLEALPRTRLCVACGHASGKLTAMQVPRPG